MADRTLARRYAKAFLELAEEAKLVDQLASDLDKVRKKFGVGRASLGSLSESVAIFDPEPLKQIASELSHQLPNDRCYKRNDDFLKCHQLP